MAAGFRHELKFICSDSQLAIIESQIKAVLEPDPNAGRDGKYIIRSLYFDDIYDTCFRENEQGIDPRSKFRIRTYNYSRDRISLEKKSKKKGMTRKDICIISPEILEKMQNGEDMSLYLNQDPVLDEWILLNRQRLFKPRMLGEYVRTPYVYKPGNVRITFDRNIVAARPDLDMFEKNIPRVAVMKNNRHVLEVKYDGFLPDFIEKLISSHHLQQTNFSKFYLGCKALDGRL